VNALASKLAEVTSLVGDGFKCLPSSSNIDFWSEAAALCKTTNLTELSAACQAELESVDFSEVRRGLYLANRLSGQSRLARAILRIKGVIIVTDQEYWTSNNEERVHLVDMAQPLAEQLQAAMRFVGSSLTCELGFLSSPTLICSETGRGVGAVVCAGVVAAMEGLSSVEAISAIEMRRGPPLRIEVDYMEELEYFCQQALHAEFESRAGRRHPERSTEESETSPFLTSSERLPASKLRSPIKKSCSSTAEVTRGSHRSHHKLRKQSTMPAQDVDAFCLDDRCGAVASARY